MTASGAMRGDPGHGGADSGAVGNGIRECDVALEVTQLMVAMVRMGGVNVQLTRTRDVTLEQQHRSRALCQPGAACVVSVHLNDTADKAPGPRGHEVYVSAHSADSRRLGELVSGELMRLPIPARTPAVKTRLRDQGDDWYYVIRDPVAAGIPAILVEVGFVSNPEDAQFLSTFWGRFAAAYAIARGVLAWYGLDPDAAFAELLDARGRLAKIAILASEKGGV